MGYLKKVGKDKFQITVTLGTNINGRKIRRYKTVKANSEEIAKGKMEAFEEECKKSSSCGSGNLTFDDMVAAWKEDYAELSIKQSTLRVYERLLATNFDMFKGKRLNSIKHRDVQRWINALRTKGLSPKTIRNHYSLLRSILRKAVQWEYLDSNPADNIELPKQVHSESSYYTEADVKRLIKALDTLTGHDLTFKVGFMLALFGGLRKGEICGLDREDIDFDNDRICIRQTRMIKAKGGVYVDSPKSAQSIRAISVPHVVILNIKYLLEQQEKEKEALGDIWTESPALLRNELGEPIYPHSLYKHFKRLLKRNNLPDLALHGLRHTHVSMLVASGEGLEEVSSRVGHAQRTTTLNIYTHLFKPSDQDIARRLNEQFLQ